LEVAGRGDGYDRSGIHVLPDDRPGANEGARTDGDPVEDRGAGTDVRIVGDGDGPRLAWALLGNGTAPGVEVGDQGGPHRDSSAVFDRDAIGEIEEHFAADVRAGADAEVGEVAAGVHDAEGSNDHRVLRHRGAELAKHIGVTGAKLTQFNGNTTDVIAKVDPAKTKRGDAA